ncbi:universal stress protein [Methylocapsa acidiphila]|uniref:universal stress protein n=1 Tax=Methylocapsa acidiphila TaxID=133552 RepID=UPI000420781A|nr:universal stress protein [Methylocapsa acidiphila]
MSYASLMVHLDLDYRNDARLKIAAELAERFKARVIGVAAQAEVTPIYYADGYSSAFIAERDLADIKQRMQQAEERFRTALAGRVADIEWRTAIERPGPFIAEQSRAADLIIVGKTASDEALDLNSQFDSSDLIGRAGRPLLFVPHEIDSLSAERVLIAWKDVSEARRAVFDSLPILQLAQQVIVAAIDEDADSLAANRSVEDVASWLSHHGVKAVSRVEPLHGRPAEQLDALAAKEGADLLVAGAYGHSKLREWILGGVTQDLLKQTSRCHLLSH